MPESQRTRVALCRVAVVVAAALLLCGGPVSAQNIGQTTGQIEGVVVDASGLVLPGVTITVTSPQLVSPRVVVTQGDGTYTMPGLAPGVYKLEAALDGFTTAVVEDIELRAGQTMRPSIKMSPGLKDEVTVVASPLIDVASSAVTNTLSADTINTLPKERSYESVVVLTPAVNTENLQGEKGISVRGASIAENSFIVDGVDTTAVVTGTAGQAVVTEFLDEVQVKSGFVGAEYGGAMGGVVNVVTKSGSNDFHGLFNVQYSGSGLTGDPRPRLRVVPTNSAQAEYVQDAEDGLQQYDFGGVLGGRLMRDRLWFFGGWMPQFQDYERTVTFLSNKVTDTFASDVRRHYATGKITAKAGANATMNFAVTVSPDNQYGTLPNLDGTSPSNADYVARGRRASKTAYSYGVDWIVSPNFFLNGFIGYHTKTTRDAGVPIADHYKYVNSNYTVAGVPPEFQGPAGFETTPPTVNVFSNDDSRFSLGLTGTLSFSAAGRHLLKVGFQHARPTTYLDYGYTGKRVDLHWGSSFFGQRGAYGYWRAFDIASDGEVVSNNQAIFIQDAWTFDRWTLNVGLRTEREDLTPYTDDPADSRKITFGFGDKIAPRVGIAWDVRGDSSWKIYVNAGRFYDMMKHSAARDGFGGGVFKIDYYTLDTYDYNLLDKDTPLGRRIFTLDLRGNGSLLDPGIMQMNTIEYSGGVEYQLSRVLTASVGYIHREIRDTVEDFFVLQPSGSYQKVLGNPGEGMITQPYGAGFPPQPKFERTYDGLDFQLRKRFARNWTGTVNYTFSRLRGNFDGLADPDQQIYGDINPNLGIYCDYLEGCYTSQGTLDSGRLTADRPHQLKLNGSYSFGFGLTVGAFFKAVSGTPITRMLGVNSATVTHPEGRMSDGRNPFTTQTDLSVNYGFKLWNTSRLNLTLNVINLFNQDDTTRTYQMMLLGGTTSIRVPTTQYFQGYDYQAAITASGSARDPRFLMADRFQAPIALRLGARFDF